MEHKQKQSSDLIEDYAEDVKKIENEAEKIIKDAEVQKEEMIVKARSEAALSYSKKEKKLESDRDEKLRKEKEKIQKSYSDKQKEDEKDSLSYEKRCEKNLGKAAGIVLKKFEEKVEEF